MVGGITLADLIRNEAEQNASHYNLRQYAKVKEQKVLHNTICKELVNLADKHLIPMGVLVYIAIGKSAHKPSVFEKGYPSINTDRAEKIIELCKIFGGSFGNRYMFNDKVVHACDKFYEVTKCVGGYADVWRNICEKADKERIVMSKIKRAQDLLKLLCGDMADYSKVGRVVAIKM